MKVVIFCGGLGVRMREVSEEIPKPMLRIGDRPILWHIMKYYAHYGFQDFILCLGYRANTVKEFFLNYAELRANNFVISQGGKEIHHLPSEIDGWNITLVDTGLHSNIGQRLKKIEPFLEGEEMFLANYGDNLTDAPIDEMVQDMREDSTKVASFVVRAAQLQLPHRLVPGRRAEVFGHRHRVGEGEQHLDQRGLLRAPPRDLRASQGRTGTRARYPQRTPAGRPGGRVASRGLLGVDGHPQGDVLPQRTL